MREPLRTVVRAALAAIVLVSLSCVLPAVAQPLVVATTSIVGDVVAQVAGESVDLIVLVPVGSDPHSFEPSPGDARRLFQADVVFAVGAGLEQTMEPLFQATGAKVVKLAERVPLRRMQENGHASHAHHDDSHRHGPYDPHVWLDPGNVALWTHGIEQTLVRLDPAGAEGYGARAAAYRSQLEELDRWIEEQVEHVPPDRRQLVADHQVLGYFADRYGFLEVGAVIPSLSTLGEPSARELAELIKNVQDLAVPALFVGTAANPVLAQTVAREAGARVVALYTESLSDHTGPAPTYIDLMRHNVAAIVEALGT